MAATVLGERLRSGRIGNSRQKGFEIPMGTEKLSDSLSRGFLKDSVKLTGVFNQLRASRK
jgi:hypothetical protein